MEGRKTQQSTETLWHEMLILQEAITCLWTNPGKPMTIMKFLFLIISCGSIKPCIFVTSYLTMFPIAISSVHPTKENQIFLHNMESISIIIRKEICQIIRGGQSTKRIFWGNRDIIWENILGVAVSFVLGGSTIKGNGR